MRPIIVSLFYLLVLISCKKSENIQGGLNKLVCGTRNWPQINCKVTCEIMGASSADSVSFDINGGQQQFGTYYMKKFINPTLPLKDSTLFCGDYGSDINVYVCSADTTKNYIFSIYVNNILVKRDTGHTYTVYPKFRTGAQCK